MGKREWLRWKQSGLLICKLGQNKFHITEKRMEIRREQKSAGNSRRNQSQIRQLPHPIAILDYDAVISHLDGFNSLRTGPNQLSFLFLFL